MEPTAGERMHTSAAGEMRCDMTTYEERAEKRAMEKAKAAKRRRMAKIAAAPFKFAAVMIAAAAFQILLAKMETENPIRYMEMIRLILGSIVAFVLLVKVFGIDKEDKHEQK